MTNSKLIEQIRQEGIDKLQDGYGEGVHGCDLHNTLYNEDYFIVGTYQAKQAMGEDAFDIIGEVQQYEKDNFGEVLTDLSNPEKVVNMYAYIKGEEFLSESETLQDCWNRMLDKDDIKAIIDELEV